MRLVTRADFDGLACAALFNSLGLIDEYKFVHPNEVQTGQIPVNENDILANVPYAPGCGMWFDHHTSEKERVGQPEFKGSSKPGPSCARVIWDYYDGYEKFPASFDPMLEAVDKVDSATLSRSDIREPEGWVLIGMIMDPRTGLADYTGYSTDSDKFVLDMIGYFGHMSAEEILALPDVQERTERYFAQQRDFAAMIERCSTLHDNVLVIDVRGEKQIYSGNRFTPYAMFPDANVSIQIFIGRDENEVLFTVGQSILNRSCTADIGSLMLAYGGGGHRRVGTCRVAAADAPRILDELIAALKGR